MDGKDLLLVGLALGGVYLYSTYKTGSSLIVGVDGVDVNSVGLLNANLTVNFKLTNPTSAPITLNSITGAVFVNNNFLGNVLTITPIVVSALATTIYPVNISIPITSSINSILSIIQTGVLDTVITFQGSINVAGFNVPLSQSTTI